MTKHKEFFKLQEYLEFRTWCYTELNKKDIADKVWNWSLATGKTVAEYYIHLKSENTSIYAFC